MTEVDLYSITSAASRQGGNNSGFLCTTDSNVLASFRILPDSTGFHWHPRIPLDSIAIHSDSTGFHCQPLGFHWIPPDSTGILSDSTDFIHAHCRVTARGVLHSTVSKDCIASSLVKQ